CRGLVLYNGRLSRAWPVPTSAANGEPGLAQVPEQRRRETWVATNTLKHSLGYSADKASKDRLANGKYSVCESEVKLFLNAFLAKLLDLPLQNRFALFL